MDLLNKFSVSCEQSREEFLQRLNQAAGLDDVKALRNSLFATAVEKGLVDSGDAGHEEESGWWEGCEAKVD